MELVVIAKKIMGKLKRYLVNLTEPQNPYTSQNRGKENKFSNHWKIVDNRNK